MRPACDVLVLIKSSTKNSSIPKLTDSKYCDIDAALIARHSNDKMDVIILKLKERINRAALASKKHKAVLNCIGAKPVYIWMREVSFLSQPTRTPIAIKKTRAAPARIRCGLDIVSVMVFFFVLSLPINEDYRTDINMW